MMFRVYRQGFVLTMNLAPIFFLVFPLDEVVCIFIKIRCAARLLLTVLDLGFRV